MRAPQKAMLTPSDFSKIVLYIGIIRTYGCTSGIASARSGLLCANESSVETEICDSAPSHGDVLHKSQTCKFLFNLIWSI
jgi:hypothetical protein